MRREEGDGERNDKKRERGKKWDVKAPIHVSTFRKPRIMRIMNEIRERQRNEGGGNRKGNMEIKIINFES
jgi:hypothetical protein